MGDSVADVQAFLVVTAAVDLHGNELGCALAITNDGLGHFHEHLEHRLLQLGEQLASGLGDLRQVRLAGGDQHAAVVGGGVAVDGDAVEGLVRRIAYQVLQYAARHLGVGRDVTEHGRHVRPDHAGALGDAGHGDGHAVVLELAAGALGQGVGGHDAGGGFGPVVFVQVGQCRL